MSISNGGGVISEVARRSSLLPWVIGFKAFKTIVLTTLGVGLLVTRHDDPADILARIALAVHLPSTSELLHRALTLAAGLTVAKQTGLAITAFGYALLMGIEGMGLFLRKPWARWFTIIATSSLLPLEVYELVRVMTPLRIVILLTNCAIVVYLYRRKEDFQGHDWTFQ
jgi:uncharacterized membrane protein (DUF2068 family)